MDYSKIPAISLEGLTKKDKGIISDNPGEPIDKLIELGLSKKGEERLNELANSVKIVEAKKTGLVPKVMKVEPQMNRTQQRPTPDTVRYESASTGVVKTMRRKSAEYLVRKSPAKGRIIR